MTCRWCHGRKVEIAIDVPGTPEIPCRLCAGAPVRETRRPFLLDTREKVAWARMCEPDRDFRLGDHCMFSPADDGAFQPTARGGRESY